MITPQDIGLPEKFIEWRPRQIELAAKAVGSQKYAFLLDSPTGTGKSLIAATAQRLLGKSIVYLVVTKQLQDQILRDFPYAKTLMGRSNYPCLRYPRLFPQVTAEECTNDKANPCPFTSDCPYLLAKREALSAPLAVLNIAYFLSEANFVGEFSGVEFLVIDEIDELDDQLMSFIEMKITKKQLERYQIPPPKFKTKIDAWREWAKNTLTLLAPRLAQLGEVTNSSEWGGVDFKDLKEKKRLERLIYKLGYLVRELDDTWVPYQGPNEWSLKPTWVSRYASPVLWDHTDKVLGMSATILDPRQLCLNTGLVSKAGRYYEYHQLPSPFPKENRPIYYEPCANIVNKEMDKALPRLAIAVEKILTKYPDDRILIHTVSYKVRDFLLHEIRSPRMITHSTQDRTQVLEKFKKSKAPLVLLSPSMERGVDLPHEECRVVIITKVPWPDLSDPQISKRVHASKDGNSWYAHKAVSSIVQASGRAIRSINDHCDTYILDSQFEKLYREYNHFFPRWYKEAIVW